MFSPVSRSQASAAASPMKTRAPTPDPVFPTSPFSVAWKLLAGRHHGLIRPPCVSGPRPGALKGIRAQPHPQAEPSRPHLHVALHSWPGAQDPQASLLFSLLGPTSPPPPSASACGVRHLSMQFSLLISGAFRPFFSFCGYTDQGKKGTPLDREDMC